MIDTHSHLLSSYYEDIDLVIANAEKANIKRIIVSGCDMLSNIEVLELVKKYDILYGSIGFHPEELEDNINNMIWLEEHVNDPKIVAIGEIGLDYHYDNYNKDLQKKYFCMQLDLAVKYNKPVVVHSRDAIGDTYDILNGYRDVIKGVIHCYSGSVEMARKFIKLGMYLGIGGILTFNNARNIIDVIKNVQLEYILLETDSPYISPVPYRGKRNEPGNVSLICEKVADVLNVSFEYVMCATTNNAEALFDFV